MDDLKKPRVVMAAVGGLLLSWSGCGDMLMPPPFGPDAGEPDPMVDAGFPVEPDAAPIDGPPPWEPPDPVFPDDPCEIVSKEQEAMYNPDMANYAIRFDDGRGLEDSPDIRQAGLLEVENGHVDNRNVIEKRFGADVLADTRSTVPGDVVPDADRRAIWSRYDDVILQTHDSIYSQKQVTDQVAFQWRRVGNWVQARMRETYANTFAVDVLNSDSARVGDAVAVTYGLNTSPTTSVRFAVYGPTMTREFEEVITGNGSRPRLSVLGPNSVMITYQLHGGAGPFPLVARRWDLNDDPPTAIITNPMTLPVINGVWDVHGAQTAVFNDEVTAWFGAAPTAAEGTLVVRIGSVTGTQAFPAAPGSLADVAVAVWPRRVAGMVGTQVRVVVLRAFQNGPNWTVNNSWIDFDPATGAVVTSAAGSTVLADAANQVHAVALSFVDRENAYVAVEQTDPGIVATPAASASRKVTYYTLARGAGLVTTGTVHFATSLVTQGAIGAGTPSDTLVSAGAEPLHPVFVEQLISISSSFAVDDTAIPRNGWVTFAPRTGEVMARSFVGYTGNFGTHAARPPKGSLVSNEEWLSWGGPVSVLSAPVTTSLNSIAACALDRTQYPNEPAMADGSAVSAHGGYPRAYDGSNPPFEHDWHTIPRLIPGTANVSATPANNVFPAGTYQLAATWEWDDANGMRYRSTPSLTSTTSGAAFESFNLTIESLTHTERSNVDVVIWASGVNGATLHRLFTTPATNTSRIQTIPAGNAQLPNFTALITAGLTISQIIERQEQLDQAPVALGQGVVGSDRARVTDFVGLAGDRLFSRDPLQGKIVRFTIPSREATGFAMHWPLEFALEEPDERDVTSVLEMDGRIVVGSELGLALLNGDGPDATGVGAFGLPTILRTEIGIEDQPQLTRTPLGYAFGTVRGGPRLLTPGLTVESLEKPVERQYKIDGGNVVAIAYDQFREEMVFLDNAQPTLRLNTSTMRWAHDSNRIGRDLTVRKDGTLYMIRSDGKVLKQRQDVWADGGVGYPLRVSTPWIRGMSKDLTSHPPFRLNGIYVSGEYVGPHDLFFDVYKDFNNVTPWATYQVPEATVVANAAANRGWVYGVRIGGQDSFYAARIVVRDGAEPNQTFRLGQMDIDVEAKNMTYVELPQSQYAARV